MAFENSRETKPRGCMANESLFSGLRILGIASFIAGPAATHSNPQERRAHLSTVRAMIRGFAATATLRLPGSSDGPARASRSHFGANLPYRIFRKVDGRTQQIRLVSKTDFR